MTVIRRPDRLTRAAGAPPGPRRADLRRAALVNAAGELFVANGVEATTVDEIVEAAGVAKGTFYHYFRSKSDLLEALRERFSLEFLGRIHRAVARRPADDWRARLEAWITEAVHAYFDMRELHDVVFHGAEMPMREAMGDIPILKDLADLIRQGASAGVWMTVPPEATAIVMFHGLHGATDEAIVTGGGPADVARLLSRLYVTMLRAD